MAEQDSIRVDEPAILSRAAKASVPREQRTDPQIQSSAASPARRGDAVAGAAALGQRALEGQAGDHREKLRPMRGGAVLYPTRV